MRKKKKWFQTKKLKMVQLTLVDIMDFMKRDKEERAIESERDKEEIKEMMNSGVNAEVKKTLKPIQERQE